MARQKLKKYRMAVGICGPTVLYTNIIKAYSPEDAARKYLEEGVAEGSVDEITDDKVAKIAKEMYELAETEALTSHYDAYGEVIGIDDTVISVVNNTIVKGTVVKLTNRSVKIAESGKEYTVTINRNDFKEISGERRPFFAKVVKVDRDTAGSTPEPGSNVAYLEIDFGTCTGFGFGTVSRISPSYVYINNDNGEELRKSIGKVSTV